MSETRILNGLREIAENFDLVLMDLWGCVHDGVRPYPAALDCLARLRDAGKSVAILSNAPRRASEVEAKLTDMGIDRALYTGMFTYRWIIRADCLVVATQVGQYVARPWIGLGDVVRADHQVVERLLIGPVGRRR